MPKGRPARKGKELKFKTVAVPEEIYSKIQDISKWEERTIARQLGRIIEKTWLEYQSKAEQ